MAMGPHGSSIISGVTIDTLGAGVFDAIGAGGCCNPQKKKTTIKINNKTRDARSIWIKSRFFFQVTQTRMALIFWILLAALIVLLVVKWLAHRRVKMMLQKAVHQHYGIETPRDPENALRLYYSLLERVPQQYQEIVEHGINDLLDRPQNIVVENIFIENSQNVHDPTVVTCVKNAVKQLQEPTPLAFGEPDVLDQLRADINLSDHKDKSKMLKTLVAMETQNVYIERYEAHELDILKKVYSQAKSDPDLLNNLLMGLRDANESGHVVCAMGRASHVITAIPDLAKDIKTTHHLKQEMNMKAARIMQQYPDDFMTVLRRDFHKDYVDAGILTEQQLDAELQSWDLDIFSDPDPA